MTSPWQARIEGVWHGAPGLFDPEGRLVGRFHVARSVVRDTRGNPLLQVDTPLTAEGPLAARFAAAPRITLAVREEGLQRVYHGPDIFGAGQPYGSLLLGNDYLRPWRADSSVIVQLLPDGETQAYSALLLDGPTLFAAVFGLYRVARADDPSADGRVRLDAFLADEEAAAASPHAIDERGPGAFAGELEVWSADSQCLGHARARIELRPGGAGRVERTSAIDGALQRRWTIAALREGNHFFFDGPDAFGNGIGYGRALFFTQHFTQEPWTLRGREVLLADRLLVAWELCEGAHRRQVLFGVLRWEGAP